jgi:hypothetical protein
LIGGLTARSYPVSQDATLRSDAAADSATLGETYVVVETAPCPPTTTCFEESAPALAYSSGWHSVASANASGGAFRVNPSKSGQGSLRFPFEVGPGATGKLVYRHARSTKGGTADVYLDGVFRQTIDYRDATGKLETPVFGFEARFEGLAAGAHTFELRNVKGAAYVDAFCLESAEATGAAASGPGATSSRVDTLTASGSSLLSFVVPVGTQSVSAVASGPGLLRLVLIDPAGVVLASADGVDGVAVLERAVSSAGTFQLKVIKLGPGAITAWTAATPFGPR